MSGWQGVQAQASAEQMTAVVEAAARDLSGLPLAVLRNRRELGQRADAAVRAALRPYPVQVSASQMQALIAQVVARVGGLGFLDALIPPNSDQFTDLLVNGDGTVWGRRKGAMRFDQLDLHPAKDEVWRAVEALLAPEGRALLRVHPHGGRQDPAQPGARLRRRARQDAAPGHRAGRRLSLAGDPAV